jgi:glutathione S-transferase
MTYRLFGHPLSSYYQKALIAFYESEMPFTFCMLDQDKEAILSEFYALWPLGKFPILVDGYRVILEASTVIEYAAPQLIPTDIALEVRMMDRIFDNYVMTPMQKFSADAMRPDDGKDPMGVADARAMLDKSYAWLDARLADRQWAAGDNFTLADCAAAPALFYADWMHPIAAELANLKAYLKRLQEHPSVARAAKDAEPYLHLVPVPRLNKSQRN